jgi:hypothetical protein
LVARVSFFLRNSSDGGPNAGGGVGFTLARREANGQRFSGKLLASCVMSATTRRRISTRSLE